LIEALNEVQTSSYTKMNCSAVGNLKRAKITVEKEAFISNQILQYSGGEISRISYIQNVSKKNFTKRSINTMTINNDDNL